MQPNELKILETKLEYLIKKLEDLNTRWPAHSVKPSMLIEREELEEEIEQIQLELEIQKKKY